MEEKPLPRGLEHVSHLFLSNGHGVTPAGPGEVTAATVLRPGRPLTRDQLVLLLRKQTAALEDGMRAIDAGVPCDDTRTIELLALDGTNQLVIINADDYINDELLMRGIDHFDWVTRNVPNLRRMYQGQTINFSLQPRVLFVAPDYSGSFRSAIRHLPSLRISCFKYHVVSQPGGVGVFFELWA